MHVFEHWLRHLRCVYGCPAPLTRPLWAADSRLVPRLNRRRINAAVVAPPSSLEELVQRQMLRLHGPALRHFWRTPQLLVQLSEVRGCLVVAYLTRQGSLWCAVVVWLPT